MQKALSFGFALWLAICAPAGAQQAAQSPAVVQANALFEEYWEWTLVEYPEFATYFGDRWYQDRLRDESAAAVARRKSFYAEFRGRLAGIDARQLPAPTRTSLQVLRYRLDRFVALNKHYGTLPFGIYEAWAPVTQIIRGIPGSIFRFIPPAFVAICRIGVRGDGGNRRGRGGSFRGFAGL